MKKPEKKSYYYKQGKSWVVGHWDEYRQIYQETQNHTYNEARHAVAQVNNGKEGY
jgi:hypothetical protein